MAADEPPYLTVGTDVSAKYKGAFCEAKIKKVNRVVKCKVTFKNNLGILMVTDDQIRGSLRIGALVEARHPEKNQFLEAIINKMQDYSQYTVVFDDGDETTLRRTSLCLKSGRHFAESPTKLFQTLDQFPLTNPEHFGTPVIGVVKSKRKRRSTYNSSTLDYSSSDEELMPKKTKVPRSRERNPDVGKVVCVDYGDRRKKDNWYPGLVVLANSAQDTFKINTKEEYLIRSFKDGKYYQVPKRDTKEFSRDASRKIDSNTLRTAVDKALLYCEKGELPPHWDKALYLGVDTLSGDDDSPDTESDTSDDEPSEEKDRFVAQLYKFMDERGTPINKAPTVSNRDVNLYKLFKVVHKIGGYNRVTNQNKWKIVYTKMGYQSSNPSGSNQLKLAYKRFLHSFEDFYRKLGCTMVSNSRSTRGRHRSDRNFMFPRNAKNVSPKTRTRGKDKSVEKKIEEKGAGSEKKETKVKGEMLKSDEKPRKKLERLKGDEKEQKPKAKKEEEKPRFVRSQSFNKEKRDNVEEKKDTRTDRARAREESKKEKSESPEKKKETRSSAKFDQEREKREKEAAEKKLAEAKEAKDRSPREKKEEKIVKETKSTAKKEEPPPKERKLERPWRERAAKEEKTKNKVEDKPVEKEKKDEPEEVPEKKIEKIELSLGKPEIRLFTREKKDKIDLPTLCIKDEKQPKLEKVDTTTLKCVKEEKEVKVTKAKEDEPVLVKEKPDQTKFPMQDHEPTVNITEYKIKKEDRIDLEGTSFESRRMSCQDDDDDFDDDDPQKEMMKKRRSGDERDDSKSFTDMTDSEEEDDGSCSERSEKDNKERQIEIGDKVRVKYGRGRTRKVYEAKVLKVDASSGEKRYYVHYAGWNMRYDEWVRRSFIVENISERSKLSRQRRQDLYNKNALSLVKRIDRSRPPGQSAAAKLTRKNSTSSTTSVSSSRTTRSDKNNSLHTSPYSKGLQPKRRTRRKSGVSVSQTDTSQDSESDEDDLLFLYPEGELNDDEENCLEMDKSDFKKDFNSDQEMDREQSEGSGKHDYSMSETSLCSLEVKIENIKPDMKNEILDPESETISDTSQPLSPKEDSSSSKHEYSKSETTLPSIFSTKTKIMDLKVVKLSEKDHNLSCDLHKSALDMTVGKKVIGTSLSTDLISDEPKNIASLEPIKEKTTNEEPISTTAIAELKISPIKEIPKKPTNEESLKVENPIVLVSTNSKSVEEKNNDACPLPEAKPATPAKETKLIEEKMPPLMTYMGSCEDAKIIKSDSSILKRDLFESKFSNLGSKIISSTPTLKLKKEIINSENYMKKIVLESNESLHITKAPDKTYSKPMNIVQRPDTFSDICFPSKSVSVTTSLETISRPSILPQTHNDIISCKECMDEGKSSSPQPDSSKNKIDCDIVLSKTDVIDKNLDSESKDDFNKVTDTNVILSKAADVIDKVEKESFSSISKYGGFQLLVKDAMRKEPSFFSEDAEDDEPYRNMIRPLKVPESEISTTYSAFPLRDYFTDFTKSSLKSESKNIDVKKVEPPESKSVPEPKPLEKIVPVAIEKKDKSAVESKSGHEQSKSSSIPELKDFGLQTSVITFVGSSATSSSLNVPEKKEPQLEVKKSVFSVSEDKNDDKLSSDDKDGPSEELKLTELLPKQQVCPDEVLQHDDTICVSGASESEEKPENSQSSTKNEMFLDDSIHESLTELSIDDESREHSETDRTERASLTMSSSSISNVFLNVSADKAVKDMKELFLPKSVASDTSTVVTKGDGDSSQSLNLSMKAQTSSDKSAEDEKTASVKDTEESASPSSVSIPKKEGKKKKSKLSRQERKSTNLDASEKDETKLKEGKGKSKKRKILDADDFNKLKDSEQKPKTKKLKRNKNKKRFTKHEDLEMGDEDKDGVLEKMKRKEKRKRDEKKFPKFDLKSDALSMFRGEASKKERKKGRKNKLGSDKKAELGDKKVKKKKKNHPDDNVDTDSEKDTFVRQSEKKKKKEKKKIKPKDTSSSDDTADGKLLIDESKSLSENQEKNDDPDMSFLLCEEKVPASPVNILPEDTTASSSIEDSNNVSPSSDEEPLQAVNLEMYPRSSNLDLLSSVNKHKAEACAVLDNTPPTTPSSTESIPSSSPSHDREPFIHYTESTQSGRDSNDGESDSFQGESNRAEVSEGEEYQAAATLAFAVCKSVPEKPREVARVPLKRQKSESEDYSPSKRKRKSKRAFGPSDAPTHSGHSRVKGLSRYTKGESCDAFDSGASAVTISSPPHGPATTLFASLSHATSQMSNVTSDSSSMGAARSSKVNFYIPLHEYKDPEKRISVLQDKMSELRKIYASLKAEVATIDRRRKKARKKMREAAGSMANNSSTHSEDAQNCS